MKSRTSWLLLGSFLLAATLWALAVPAAELDTVNHTRWEHLALTHDDAEVGASRDLPPKIVRLGDAGWELVNVSTVVKDGSTVKTNFCFKRPK